MAKKILILCRQPPYGSPLARAALEIALATSVFDQQLSLLFSGDGIWQLLKNQQASAIDEKSIEKLIAAFPMYDIDSVYVDAESMRERNIELKDLSLEAQLLEPVQISAFCEQFDIVLSL